MGSEMYMRCRKGILTHSRNDGSNRHHASVARRAVLMGHNSRLEDKSLYKSKDLGTEKGGNSASSVLCSLW